MTIARGDVNRWRGPSALGMGLALVGAALLHAPLLLGTSGWPSAGGPLPVAPARTPVQVVSLVPTVAEARFGHAADRSSHELRGEAQKLSALPSAHLAPSGDPSFSPSNTRYFAAHQVDRTPRPLTDWFIDSSVIEIGTTLRLRMSVWVDGKGRVQRWQVEEGHPQAALVQALLRPLPETPMEPAIRRGVAVAAVLEVDLAVDVPGL